MAAALLPFRCTTPLSWSTGLRRVEHTTASSSVLGTSGAVASVAVSIIVDVRRGTAQEAT